MGIIEIIENYGRALKVEDLAEVTQVSSKTLYRHIRAGKLLAYRIGGQLRLDPKKTAEWLRARLR